ncbi:DUF3953 domain-containing protein [Halobacillus litoralis]|uniref:DUF3953 domain-containing protein n=1 Tax=Halobacillus litoralis TaxID=45668 RepID=A0A410M9H7_9BACI|nr:DUF3953 domain-containing protein [Halobacillus litoralis]QAS51336.1 hypothetical protein HLI_03460 [Halobacillus litoralis]
MSLLLNASRNILSVLILFIVAFGLITKNFLLMPLMMLFLGGLMLVMGVEQLQANKESMGYPFVFVSLLCFCASFQIFTMN